MSEAQPPAPRTRTPLLDAILQFRRDIGAVHPFPNAARTLPHPTPKPRYRHKLVTALSLLTLVMAGVDFAPKLAGSDAVPTELIGSWMTDEPGYEGRYLELTPDALILRASAREGTAYTVRRVQRRQTTQGSAYVITAYSELSGDLTLTLEYREAGHTIAQGKPTRVLWRRPS
jgi:hypothetical protein